MMGAWQLKNMKGLVPLYTRVPADVVKNIETGEEYVRSENYVIFGCSWNNVPLPVLVETLPEYKLFTNKHERAATQSDMLKEITVNSFFK